MAAQSTWRQQKITLDILSSREVNFKDTHPNYIYFANNSAYNVYISVSPLVSASDFDMIIPPYATKLYAREEGMTQIFLYNGSSLGSANIVVVSFEGAFDARSLPQTQEIVGASAAGLLGIIDVNAITSALPTGTNTIGAVTLAAALPAGTNNIGDVDIASALPAGTNNIGDVDIASAPDIALAVPTIYNVTMTAANTEYSQLITNAKRLRISTQDGDSAYSYRLAFVTGKVASPTAPYISHKGDVIYNIDKLNIASLTVYCGCTTTGKILQIEVW